MWACCAHSKTIRSRCIATSASKTRYRLLTRAVWPGGSVGPASRWAAASNAKVGHTTYFVNRERLGRMRAKGATRRRTEKEKLEWWIWLTGSCLAKRAVYLYICFSGPRARSNVTVIDGASLPYIHGGPKK